ncbi:hypothetical protein FoTM2_017778 [Fusarium oxysporum f. sp. vasinfectum]|nr:hypothetical protein FoTM2_017778 [Fusarium oxysporum f. sp. vasinfectum]
MDASQGQHGSHRQPAPPPASAPQFPLHTHPYPVYQLPLNPQLNPPKNYRPRRRNPHGGPPKRKKPKPGTQMAPVPYGYGHHPIYHQLPPDAVAETYGGTASTDEVSDEEQYDSYPISNERDSGGDDSQEQLQHVLEKLDNQSEAFNAQ